MKHGNGQVRLFIQIHVNSYRNLGVVLEALPLESEVNFSGDNFSYHRHTLTHQRSSVLAGTDATITSDGDLVVRGMDLVTGEKTRFVVGRDFYDIDVHDSVEESSFERHKKKGLVKSKTSTASSQSASSSAQGNTSRQESVGMSVKRDAHLQTGRWTSSKPEESRVSALKLFFEGGESSSASSFQCQKKSAFVSSSRAQGHTAITHPMGYFTPGTNFEATEGAVVTINATLDQLEQNPATAWIKDLRKIPAVRWNLVHDEYDQWRHKSRALTPGCAAIIALAASIATAGLGAGVAGSTLLIEAIGETATTALGIMTHAGMATLTTNATTSLINNRGHLGKTLKDIGSSAQLRELATSIAVAGATAGLSSQLGIPLDGKEFTDLLQRSAVQTGVSTASRMATQGLDLREGVIQGIANIVADTAAASAAQYVGNAFHPVDSKTPASIGWVEHKALQAAIGAVVGAVSNLRDPLEGAKGGAFAALAETVAELTDSAFTALNLHETTSRQTLMRYAADIGRMATALTSFALRQDVNATVLASTNAVENNFGMTHYSVDPRAAQREMEEESQILFPVVEETITEIPVLAQAQGYAHQGVDWVYDTANRYPWLRPLLSSPLNPTPIGKLGRGVEHFVVDMIPTTPLDIALLFPAVTGSVGRGVVTAVKGMRVLGTRMGTFSEGVQVFSREIMNALRGLNVEGIHFVRPSQVARAIQGPGIPQVRLNYQAGRGFQTSVHEHLRIPENNTIYNVLLRGKGTLTTRPDLPLPLAGVTDVKNVQYITFTKQLQAQAALAKQEGTSFNLVISRNTQRISEPLWEAIRTSNGKVFEFNSTTKTWIERIIDGNIVLR